MLKNGVKSELRREPGKPGKIFRRTIFRASSLPISLPAIETVFKNIQRASIPTPAAEAPWKNCSTTSL
jgi:hypothetical protein